MRSFAYERPESMDVAIARLAGHGDGSAVRPLAGGTDLLTLMKSDIVAPDTLIDIKRIPELDDRIEATGDGTTVGALATLTQLEQHQDIRTRFPALAQAAGQSATPQLRNMATLGGNVLQRPRCWYFRDPDIACWLKGGDSCPAREGENTHNAIFQDSPCVAVHPSDSAAVLIAYDARVRIRGRISERTVPIGDFFMMPTDGHRRENVLEPGELILGFTLPRPDDGARSVYLKAMDRKTWAFALVGVAVSVTIRDGTISDARVVLGGVAPIPRRLMSVEQALRGAIPDGALFHRMAALALEDAQPLSRNTYKVDLARTMIERALTAATMVVA